MLMLDSEGKVSQPEDTILNPNKGGSSWWQIYDRLGIYNYYYYCSLQPYRPAQNDCRWMLKYPAEMPNSCTFRAVIPQCITPFLGGIRLNNHPSLSTSPCPSLLAFPSPSDLSDWVKGNRERGQAAGWFYSSLWLWCLVSEHNAAFNFSQLPRLRAS